MKSKFLIILAAFFLVSCSNSNPTSEPVLESFSSESIEEEISEASSESVPNETESSEQPSEEHPSEEESEPTLDEEEDQLIQYTSHPTSEPHINYQLHTLSAIGDIYTVWEHYRGDGVKVAIIDNNFRITHEDFFYENGQSKISNDSARIYKNGSLVKIEVGKDKAGIDASSNWHGTMCAGLLGAANNNKGTTGIAPNCELLLIKVDNSPEAISEAFKYAADCGVKVISISLGNYANPNGATSGDIIYPRGFDLSTAFQANINYAYNKGVTIVSAVGNDKRTELTYPAGCKNVIGAGGLNPYSKTQIWDEGYEGTNYNGAVDYVDVYAPSSGIYTPGSQSDKGYMDGPNAKGTSFSAPIIAGAAALYFQKYPQHNNLDFENALKETCVNISSYNQGKDTGYGALDVYKLLNMDEDVKPVSYQPTGTQTHDATIVKVNDQSGWCFNTLHTWNFSFFEGYGYKDLEYYFARKYGNRTLTNSYSVESTYKTWTYTDEGFIGDYYLNTGNGREFIFPWWVKDFSFQVVNNNHWLPENGGYKINVINGFHKKVNVSIVNGDISYNVLSGNASDSIETIRVDFVGNDNIQSEISSVFDYYLPSVTKYKFYLDQNHKIPYYRQVLRHNTTLYF